MVHVFENRKAVRDVWKKNINPLSHHLRIDRSRLLQGNWNGLLDFSRQRILNQFSHKPESRAPSGSYTGCTGARWSSQKRVGLFPNRAGNYFLGRRHAFPLPQKVLSPPKHIFKKLIREITVTYKPGKRTTVLIVMENTTLGAPHIFNLSSPSRVVIDYPVKGHPEKNAQGNAPARKKSHKGTTAVTSSPPSKPSPAIQTKPGNNGKVYIIPGKKLQEKKKETGTTVAPPPVAIESDYTLPIKTRRMRVVLDAGHGGKDCGTTSVNGYCEKDLVLDIVRRLGLLLSQDGRFQVFYTRTDDSFISLKDRTRIANRDHGDLFLSVHANADPDPSVRGIQTYLLTLHSKDKRAMALAKRENASLGAAGDLGAILLTLRINHKKKHSMELASSLDNALIGTLSSHYSGIRDFGIKHAPFYVIMGTSMPAVLTEVNFLSNRKDAALMAQGRYRQRVAQGLYQGIISYDRWVHPEKINRLASANLH